MLTTANITLTIYPLIISVFAFSFIFRGVSVSAGPYFLALCIRDIELRGKTWLHSKRTLDLFIAFGDIHLRYQSHCRQRGV